MAHVSTDFQLRCPAGRNHYNSVGQRSRGFLTPLPKGVETVCFYDERACIQIVRVSVARCCDSKCRNTPAECGGCCDEKTRKMLAELLSAGWAAGHECELARNMFDILDMLGRAFPTSTQLARLFAEIGPSLRNCSMIAYRRTEATPKIRRGVPFDGFWGNFRAGSRNLLAKCFSD